jgi:16S rRNA processing protein RimM
VTVVADEATLALGVLGRPHGVKGEIVFHAFNPGGAQLSDLDLPLTVELRRASAIRSVTVTAARPFKDGALVRLEGVTDRDGAAALTGHELHVPRAVLPPLEDDEVYTGDLIGCAVFDLQGNPRGKVAAIYWNGSHDVLSVLDEAGQELLVPAVPDFLPSIDLTARKIVVDPHE